MSHAAAERMPAGEGAHLLGHAVGCQLARALVQRAGILCLLYVQLRDLLPLAPRAPLGGRLLRPHARERGLQLLQALARGPCVGRHLVAQPFELGLRAQAGRGADAGSAVKAALAQKAASLRRRACVWAARRLRAARRDGWLAPAARTCSTTALLCRSCSCAHAAAASAGRARVRPSSLHTPAMSRTATWPRAERLSRGSPAVSSTAASRRAGQVG